MNEIEKLRTNHSQIVFVMVHDVHSYSLNSIRQNLYLGGTVHQMTVELTNEICDLY